MKEGVENINVCIQFNCSMCCNPVKIKSTRIIDTKDKNIPFVELGKMAIPKEHPDSVRLKLYNCSNFNIHTGLCDNYSERPEICKNTKCPAFQTTNLEKQAEIIGRIKSKEFIYLSLNNYNTGN